MNTLEAVSIVSPYGETEECAKLVIEDTGIGYLLDNVAETGKQYTLQFWVKAASASSVTVADKDFAVTTAWAECVTTFEMSSPDLVFSFSAAGTYYIFEPQLEIGNQKTDYSEAPEDAEARLDNKITVTAGQFSAELSKRVLQTDYDGQLREIENEFTRVNAEAGKLQLEVGTKVTQDEVDKSIGEIDEFHGTTVDITGEGFKVKAGGTVEIEAGAGVMIETGGAFNVASDKFSVDENGEMSAVNARISGQISVDGHDVWHKGQLIVSTAQPSNPTENMIWAKPDTSSIPAAGTWTAPALTSRPWENPYNVALAGTSIGAAPSNATYTYTVRVPVFHTFNNTTETKVKVFLGSASGAETIAMGEQTFSEKGAAVYEATVVSNTWLGNSGTIWIKVEFGDGGNMTVNSHEAISCTLTAKSTSGGTGWKNCTVQIYMG